MCEKTILETLGVGCQWPVGVNSKVNDDKISIFCELLSPEGEILARIDETSKKDKAISTAQSIGEKLRDDSL
jgi:hydroxymethylbilane synthase